MQRGFTIPSLMQIVVVLGLVTAATGAIWGAIAWHARTNFERGVEHERAAALAEALEREAAVSVELDDERKKSAASGARADKAERDWREAKRDADRKGVELGSCYTAVQVARSVAGAVGPDRAASAEPDSPAAPPSAVGGLAPPAPRIRVSWRFVELHDSAFTGLGGEPLFADPARAAGDAAGADAASPYTLHDVADVAGDNARALSACRRVYFRARAAIERAAQAWEQR